MKKKNLAEEYATARLKGRLSGNEMSFSENKIFTEEDIECAFSAGRESVVENIPNLEWEKCVGGYVAETPFGEIYIEVNEYVKEKYTLVTAKAIARSFANLRAAKQAANEDYKNRIKRVLRL